MDILLIFKNTGCCFLICEICFDVTHHFVSYKDYVKKPFELRSYNPTMQVTSKHVINNKKRNIVIILKIVINLHFFDILGQYSYANQQMVDSLAYRKSSN